MLHTRSLITRTWLFALAASIGLLGCSSTPHTAPTAAEQPESHTAVLTARSGRYTLVEIAPEDAQRDLMRQVIDVSAPRALPATVADMLRYVLLRSGYSMCEGEALTAFESLSLPAAHFQLGPITLRDALEVLAGPAWRLAVDDVTREVCFVSLAQSVAAVSGAKP